MGLSELLKQKEIKLSGRYVGRPEGVVGRNRTDMIKVYCIHGLKCQRIKSPTNYRKLILIYKPHQYPVTESTFLKVQCLVFSITSKPWKP